MGHSSRVLVTRTAVFGGGLHESEFSRITKGRGMSATIVSMPSRLAPLFTSGATVLLTGQAVSIAGGG